MEKKSLKEPRPLISKSSTRKVFEILKLVCRKPRYAKVADGVGAFDVLRDAIRSQIQSIG